MVRKDIRIKDARILVLGVTFKENCPDVRNTRVVDVVHSLEEYGSKITIYDPWANPEEVMQEYGLETIQDCPSGNFDAIVLAVAHKKFNDLKLANLLNPVGVVYDVKGILGHKADGRL